LAWEGILFIFISERNMRIHCGFAVLAVISAYLFKISNIELIFVIFAITLVLITEAANTAFELLLDFIHGDRYHPDVKLLKDIAAGGVFIAALNAFVIGCIIFIPRIWHVATRIVYKV
jgi:undecaprenol kinase